MTTPMFKQYHQVKKALNNEILFFRMGDFYEMFYNDAKLASKVLGIALTQRSNGSNKVPMAGIPFHAANNYLKKLIQAGYKVAICDQVEDAKLAKGLVRREVTRIVTAGTLLEDDLLDEKKSNFLLAIFLEKKQLGLCWVDISTGSFFGLDTNSDQLLDEIQKISPSECLIPEKIYRDPNSPLLQDLQKILSLDQLTSIEDWHFNPKEGHRKLKKFLNVKDLKGFGLHGKEFFFAASSALLEYVQQTRKSSLSYIQSIQKIHTSGYMQMDMATQRTLELVQTMSGGNRKFSLLGVLDHTQTPMGSRLLTWWILHPLTSREEILKRQKGVAELVNQNFLQEELKSALEKVYDLERLSVKISSRNASPRDLVALRTSLLSLPDVKKVLKTFKSKILHDLYQSLDTMTDVFDLLEEGISETPPLHLTDGGVIRKDYNSSLEGFRKLTKEGQNWLHKYCEKESLETGIPTLKIGSNNVFGYYIEVTHAQAHKVPANYIRKQTLKNAERYITPELKEYEEKVLSAKEEAISLEIQLFGEIRETIAKEVIRIQKTGKIISILDCLLSLAKVAVKYSYEAPEIVEEFIFSIKEGRHPVLETTLADSFVPNDILMKPESHLFLITGPNMAGKSTYIRQIALIAVMAQIGSFVPVQTAQIGLVDKLFTRLGSSDELYLGLSTFMVEMLETSNILNNATSKSLVILDEVGRGTSTYDGVSLAWAICEYIHNQVGCRTLFATHYHELTELSKSFPKIANFRVAIKEWGEEILFLHKIQEGPTNRSYGIHVAQLAGMPKSVIERAEDILVQLEGNSTSPESPKILHSPPTQLSLFQELKEESKLMKKIRKWDLDQMTPLDALLKLKELQNMVNFSESK